MLYPVLAFLALSLAGATPTDFQLLFNPGPSFKCLTFRESSPQLGTSFPYTDDSQCGMISGFTVANAPTFNYNWIKGTLNPSDGPVGGGGGSPFTITLLNDAQNVGQCGTLQEVQVGYDFPGSAIRKMEPSDVQYDLSLYDQWIVSYDVFIHVPTLPDVEAQGCQGFNRKYLETDFIYYWTPCSGCAPVKNVISVIHYNPIHTNAALGPFQEDGGYRIQINGPPSLVPGQMTHVALDFKAILQKYSTELCHNGGIPTLPNLYSLQIVSSNVNTSSTIDISNVSLILRNNPDPGTAYPVPDYPAGTTPNYCSA
ncbi:hypothetical protein C8F04DRAFT_1302187 [Mycena alexandri]|uniref:Uncharacterized protein n=1 Tax=Mycena alexandri TaxID=1745969 RepID=A0AAD6T992_9AGAR|nr:hypothetical protein C8F04DRAFT_1302187 [Mycena alexandri]